MLMVVMCLDRLSPCAEAHDARTRAMWTCCSGRPEVGQAGELGVMGQHWSSQRLHMPVAPAAFADLSRPRQDGQVI
jgi:hypothetical protein